VPTICASIQWCELEGQIRTTDEDRQEWQLSSQADYLDALREHFGIAAAGPGKP